MPPGSCRSKMMCLAPLVLIGSLVSIETSWHRTDSVVSPMLEVQTCERGIGLDVKAASAGYYGLGMQYGWQWQFDPFSVGLLPKAGLSYVDHPVSALPMRTQFEVGAQLLTGYQSFRLGIEYWHLSNAGLRQSNIGMDFLIVQTGWAF